MTAGKGAAVTAEELRALVLVEITLEEDCLRAAEVEHRAALAELTVQGAELQAAHDRAAAVARATFGAVPALPDLPDDRPHQEALHQILRAREALITRRGEALATALPTIVLGWDTARAPLDAQARAIASQAAELAESYASWHRLLSEARRAAEQDRGAGRIRNGPSTRMRPRPTAVDVIDAALGANLCGVGPSDADVRVQLVTGVPDDHSGRVAVPPVNGPRGPRRGDR